MIKHLSKADILKKIDYRLKSNFFSFAEFSSLSKRKSYKAVKMMAKIDGIHLKRREIKEVVLFLKKPSFNKQNVSVIKVWDFIKQLSKNISQIFFEVANNCVDFIECYMSDKFEVMLN